MRKDGPAGLILAVITATAGLLLGVTNAATGLVIERRAAAAADSERSIVFPAAETFRAMTVPEGGQVDDCYEAVQDGEAAGYVCRATERGYGGAIQVTVGIDRAGLITGLLVGGPDFAETAGLGAKVKEPAFTGRFIGKAGIIGLREKVDAGAADGTGEATIWEESGADGAGGATWEAPAETVGGDGSPGTGQGDGAWDGASGATEPIEAVTGAETYIDGVSGATYSSMAVVKAVNKAVAYVQGLQ